MSQSETLDSLASLLECPVCLESFTDPRMLADCFHTLCYKCLSDHIEHFGQGGQFECPVCRATVDVPDDGVGFFPKNFFMNSFLAALTKARIGLESAATEKQNTIRNALCSNWEDGSDCTEPEHFCTICCEYYCKNCSWVHRKSKFSRDHELIAFDDVDDKVLRDATLKAEVPRCMKHNKKLKLYCSTCKCAVCSTCCPISHQSHNFREMADVDNELKGELRSALTALKQLIEDANNQIDETNKQEVTHDQNTAGSKEATKSIIQKMHKMIDLKGQEIDQKLSQMNAEARSRTDAQNKQTTLFVGQLESLQSFVFDLLDKGSVFNRLASMPEVDRHLHKLNDFSLEVSTVVQTKSELLGNTVDSLVLVEEVPLDEENNSLKIRQTCCIASDKKHEIRMLLLSDRVFRLVPSLLSPHLCIVFTVIAALFASFMQPGRPILNNQNTVIELDRYENEATISWSVSNLDSCTLVLVIVCEMNTNNCVDNLLRDVSKSSLASVPQGSAYWFSFHFYYGSGHLSMYGNAMFISSKLTVQQYRHSSNAVQGAVRSLGESLHCDLSPIAYGRLQDVPSHHPQVDVIICLNYEINSVIAEYKLNKQTAEKRHLVLLHWALETGDIKDTLRILGDNQVLFKRVIRYEVNDHQSVSAATASLANYFLEVTGQNMNK